MSPDLLPHGKPRNPRRTMTWQTKKQARARQSGSSTAFSEEGITAGPPRFPAARTGPSNQNPAKNPIGEVMSTKQIVQDLLERLPEDVSLHDVAREIEFVAAVRQG